MEERRQGNEDLDPEESENLTYGVVITPLENLTITLDYWEIEQDGVVGLLNADNAVLLDAVLREQGVDLLRVDLTGYRLHIDGALVMIDVDTAIINPVLLPFWFLEKLGELGIRTVEVQPDDPTSTVNCLAVAPGRVVMSAGISEPTLETLEAMGVEVVQVPYESMYLGGGGIHCSTCPLVRDSVY